MKIDAHVHFTPPELAAKLDQFAEQEPYWGLLLNPPEGKSIQGWASPERMIDDMDAAGIDKVVLVGEYFYHHDNCVARNTQALDLINRYPERVIALATIQPLAGDKALAELERCLDGGMVGVGELNPYAQGHRMDDPLFLRLVEACVTADLPLNLHVSEEIGGYYLGKSTTPLRHYYELACEFPELKLILAHWGGGLFFYEIMPRVRKQLANVWYDTAASPLLYPTKRIFAQALSAVNHRKILYGSDYPLLIYPRKMSEPDMRPLPRAIDKLGLAPEVYDDIMGLNAARLFVDERENRVRDLVERPSLVADGEAHIDLGLSVAMVAREWPETQAVFARYGIPWRDETVPTWEPIRQAAVAQGMGATQQERLLDELMEAVGA